MQSEILYLHYFSKYEWLKKSLWRVQSGSDFFNRSPCKLSLLDCRSVFSDRVTCIQFQLQGSSVISQWTTYWRAGISFFDNFEPEFWPFFPKKKIHIEIRQSISSLSNNCDRWSIDKRSTIHNPGDLQTIYLSLSLKLNQGLAYVKLSKIISNQMVVTCIFRIHRVIYLVVQ